MDASGAHVPPEALPDTGLAGRGPDASRAARSESRPPAPTMQVVRVKGVAGDLPEGCEPRPANGSVVARPRGRRTPHDSVCIWCDGCCSCDEFDECPARLRPAA